MYSEILTEISVSAAIKRGKEKPFNMYEEMKQEENVLIRYNPRELFQFCERVGSRNSSVS